MDFAVVGGGVVGLAVARALSMRFPAQQVCLIERNSTFGMGVSSRSSEVIHAGIYYAQNSNKARLCVEGRHMLTKYCKERHITVANRGKLLVATTPTQLPLLDGILHKARANNVERMERLDGKMALQLEPALHCVGALLSPSTSVIDSRQYMASLESEATDNGVIFAYHSNVHDICLDDDRSGFNIEIEHVPTKQREWTKTRCLINCAGLDAVKLASRTITPSSIATKYCKGNYFKTKTQRVPFSHLIYPIPEAHGLGVHLTIDVHGNARFGPDVEWTDKLDYRVDATRAAQFETLVRQYWPQLLSNELEPDYAGFRPKYESDFEILDESIHGIRNLVHCLGIESPGLTSSLALAEHIATRVS